MSNIIKIEINLSLSQDLDNKVKIPIKIKSIEYKIKMKNKKILIIDDDPQVRDLIKQIFMQRKIASKIEEACDGIEAGIKIQSENFDIIICDNHMPNLNGIDFLHEVLSTNKIAANKVIFTSGSIEPEDVHKLIKLGLKSIITKPICIFRLIDETTLRLSNSNLTLRAP